MWATRPSPTFRTADSPKMMLSDGSPASSVSITGVKSLSDRLMSGTSTEIPIVRHSAR